MAGPNLDLKALSAAICEGVARGNETLIASLVIESNKRHDLRNIVQTNVDKIWEVDGELKLLKGVTVMLVGSGDGSTGMVPRMEQEMAELKDSVSSVKSDMREIVGSVSTMKDDVKAIRDSQASQAIKEAQVTGGVAVGRWIIGVCIAIIGFLATALIWLFSHGLHA